MEQRRLVYSVELQRLGDSDDIDIDDIKGISATIQRAVIREQPAYNPIISLKLHQTWSRFGVFVVAMILHPQFQCKAQEEIDFALGSTSSVQRSKQTAILP